MSIRVTAAYNFPQEVKELFTEYTNMLVEGDAAFKEYLAVQNYDKELENLDVKYGPPYGRLYLTYCDGKLAGCIGLKKLDEDNCEMKRLYVRPEFRGRRIGHTLIQLIIKEAVGIGYSFMLLDTLPFLKSAVHMYKEYGFVEVPSYNDSPMDASIYMKLDLKSV